MGKASRLKKSKHRKFPKIRGHRLMRLENNLLIFRQEWNIKCECGYALRGLVDPEHARGEHQSHILDVIEGRYSSTP